MQRQVVGNLSSYDAFVNKYNRLVKAYQSSNEELKTLRAENESLKKMLLSTQQASSLRPEAITYERFLKELRYKFTFDTMPDKSGIYVYHNRKTFEIYVGQSVNMKRRLQQHFKNGSSKTVGHDSEFKNLEDWDFYVLEYINRNHKNKLDEREAYWICLARAATANKKQLDLAKSKELANALLNGESIAKSAKSLYSTKKEKGTSTNRTKGNNLKK